MDWTAWAAIAAITIGPLPIVLNRAMGSEMNSNERCEECKKFDCECQDTWFPLDSWPVGGLTAFAVENPGECHDFSHLTGKTAMIDGKAYRIKGVERFCHSPPWRKGEKIGLLVEPLSPEPVDHGKPEVPDAASTEPPGSDA